MSLAFLSVMFFSFSTPTLESFQMEFASAEEARKLLLTEDAFTDAWSAFDIDSRMGKASSTKAELFSFIGEQVREWTKEEKKKINESIARIKKSLAAQEISLNLVDPVVLIKTTSKEEGGAMGYTRSSFIVLSESFSNMGEEDIDKILVHELFHVISRSNPELRKKLYALIGFEIMPKIDYPEVLKPLRITNPDATQTDSYINLQLGEETISCMMILYAKANYTGGSFFNYLNIAFLKLEGESEKTAVIGSDGPVLFRMDEVENFYEQVGKNTKYIIHPEEIMADNFAFAVLGTEGLENPELVERIREVLRKRE